MVRSMQSLLRVLVVPVLLVLAAPLTADEGPKTGPEKPVFPASWVGTWSGRCDLVRDLVQPLPAHVDTQSNDARIAYQRGMFMLSLEWNYQ